MLPYADVADRLMGFDDRELGEGATEEEIVSAEKALGIRIAGGYRQFLKQFGWGGVGHLELYGLGADVPAHLNLVIITRSERVEMQPALPHHLVPIMNDGGGNLYCIDTHTMDEPTIVFWDHAAGTDQEPHVQAVDFSFWLNEQLATLEE
jgi:hypothetical protein